MKTIKTLILLLLLVGHVAHAQIYYVAKTGSDKNPGTQTEPFLTISQAAKAAGAGDTVIVHEGVYREQVNLTKGGKSEEERLVFKAADGEDVAIKGSEVVDFWEQQESLWTVKLNKKFFPKKFNPYKKLVKYPRNVWWDKEYGGVGWQTYGYEANRGNVFINDLPLVQVFTIEDVKSTKNSWYAKVKGKKTTLHANFGELNPNEERTEVLVREKVFAAKPVGKVDYVTVSGFTLHHAATYWAPPTVYQTGLVEPHAGAHWIIENNDIGFSRAACVSVGVPKGDPEEAWEGRGHHIIRNNKIHNCGQSGIAGQYFADYSHISGNWIENINIYTEFGGWETAGIKLHHNNHSVIENNFIRNIYTIDPVAGSAHGIWIDYENYHTVIRNNIVTDVESHPLLLEANWNGPFLIANNIFIGTPTAIYSSLNQVWAHNLFVDSPLWWTNQGFGGRPAIDNEFWANNIFIGQGGLETANSDTKIPNIEMNHNLYLDGAQPHETESSSVISDTESKFSLTVNDYSVDVSIHLSGDDLSTDLRVIDQSLHGMPIYYGDESEAIVDTDFFGNTRSKTPQWGPFEDLKAGKNSYQIKF